MGLQEQSVTAEGDGRGRGPSVTCHHLSMFKPLRAFLDSLLPVPPEVDARAHEHSLQLATAVMLVEVMRADATFHPGEREAVLTALRDTFSLTGDEAAHLAELAKTAAREATDMFTFTSRINDHFDMPGKVRMIEYMWRVAYADGHLGDHERHVLWRIADLLHVPQGAYVHARMRAQQASDAA
jgi:uncharacterized tellurite resistance protein B-like protein